MHISRSFDAFPKDVGSTVVTIGYFDGVHLGHQRVLKKTVSTAKEHQKTSVAVTFVNHPLELLRPGFNVQNLCSLEHKLQLLEEIEIDHVILLEFTRELAAMSAEYFLNCLHIKLRCTDLILGYDAAFGKDKQGDKQTVITYAKTLGINVDYVEAVYKGDAVVSSTRIRLLIMEGDLNRAEELLGHPY